MQRASSPMGAPCRREVVRAFDDRRSCATVFPGKRTCPSAPRGHLRPAAATFGRRRRTSPRRHRPELVSECRVEYVPLADLYACADIVSLHVPLTPATHHMVDA